MPQHKTGYVVCHNYHDIPMPDVHKCLDVIEMTRLLGQVSTQVKITTQLASDTGNEKLHFLVLFAQGNLS